MLILNVILSLVIGKRKTMLRGEAGFEQAPLQLHWRQNILSWFHRITSAICSTALRL